MKGYRTRCKSEIARFIINNGSKGFTINGVHEYLSEKGVNVDVSTVYRNIKALEKAGVLVGKKNGIDDCIVYQYQEYGELCKNHLHLQCKNCGSIIHTDETVMREIVKYIEKKCGYSLDNQSSMFMGVCNKCKKEK